MSEFRAERAGEYRKNLSGELTYFSYVPHPLPPYPAVELNEDGIRLLVETNKSLAVLESVSGRIPDMDLFASMYVRKEALMSSQIEGTQATLEDVLDPMINENMNRDVADVVNYIRATDYAIGRLKDLPLCNRLIRETHAVLMENVRGQEKDPGQFRKSQNWIGGQGSTLKDARYIPPNPEDMEMAMKDLEAFMNEEDRLDALVKAALIHYQFETIHPFLDGNGRIGRLLITLFLMEKKVLSVPSLYISYYLKKNRVEYYDRLSEVRLKGNYEQWVLFFLNGIKESCEDALRCIDLLRELHSRNVKIIDGMGRTKANTRIVFDYLESHPIIDISGTAQNLNLSFNTVSSAVMRLEETGILVQMENKNRNRTFAYEEYLDILRDGTL